MDVFQKMSFSVCEKSFSSSHLPLIPSVTITHTVVYVQLPPCNAVKRNSLKSTKKAKVQAEIQDVI